MDDLELEQRLATRQRQVFEAQQKLDAFHELRLDAIRDARAAGWSLAKIGDKIGLSRQRVEQLLR